MRQRSACPVLVLILLAITGCGPAASRQATDGALRVTATFSVLGDLVSSVGGEHIALTILAGPGTDSHTYSPSPSDAAALAQSQVVFENGLEFETWLDELYIASGSQAVRTVVSEGIELRAAAEAEGQGEDAHVEGDSDEDHGAYDPHVWHSAANAVVMVRNISAALAAADPSHAADYQANAEAYAARLQELDDWIFMEVQAVPVGRRVMVTTHDTFGYFADRYGFTIVGTVLPTSTEGASPSAQELAALIEAIRTHGVTAVFAENMASSSLLSQVAREAGVEVVASLFTDALGPEGSAGATYLEMMRFNVATIVQALAG